ncbi:MAG: NAD-dependent epimerase/dehydratase family protein, partial [Desulfobacterales bacterium]
LGTIALTGATGFIGNALVRRLEAAGGRIRALVRPASAHTRLLAGTSVQRVEGDLADPDSLRRLVHDAEAVVHCAGRVRGASQADFDRVNVDSVAQLVQVARRQHRVPRFLLISSLAAREPHLSAYAASKRQGEEVLAAAAGAMPWAAFRPPAVYGPGDRELLPLFRWMSRGITPVLGTRNARFALLFVEDLAEAVLGWLDCRKAGPFVFELHDGRPGGYTWNDVIATASRVFARGIIRIPVPEILLQGLAALNLMTARRLGYAPMLTPGKVRELRHPDWVCDNRRLSEETGWAPRVALEEGLRRTLGQKMGL